MLLWGVGHPPQLMTPTLSLMLMTPASPTASLLPMSARSFQEAGVSLSGHAGASSWQLLPPGPGAKPPPSPWMPWTVSTLSRRAQGAQAGARSRSLPSGSDMQDLVHPKRDGLATRKHKGAMTFAGASGEAARRRRGGVRGEELPVSRGPDGKPHPTGCRHGLRGLPLLPARRPQPWEVTGAAVHLRMAEQGGEERWRGLRSGSVRACQGQPLLSTSSM